MAVTPKDDNTPPRPDVAPEQCAYATVLAWVGRLGLAVLVVTFALYVSRARVPHVPLRDLPLFWSLSCDKFQQATGSPKGWGWVERLHTGDYMNFAGFVLLAGVSGLCYLRVLPIFIRNRDWVFAAVVAVEIALIVLVASGVVRAEH